MVEPLDETLRGLGPGKRRLNKKVLVGAILTGFVVAGTKLWPQYGELFTGLLQVLGF